MCGILISGLANLFSRLAFGEIYYSARESYYIIILDILPILEVLNVIFRIFVQTLSKKIEVIEKKCTKAYYVLSVLLQTD